MKRGRNCFGHEHRDKVPIETHHILPQEFGGKTVRENLADGCANAHSDTHYYLNLLLKNDGVVPYIVAREFGIRIRNMAQRGYDEIKKNQAVYDVAQTLAIARLDNDVKMEAYGKQLLNRLFLP